MKPQPNGAEPIAALIIVGVFSVLLVDTIRGTTIPPDMMILMSNVVIAVTSWYFGVHATVSGATSAQESVTTAAQAAAIPPAQAPGPGTVAGNGVHPVGE